jgi:hypothetical protein
MDLRRLVNVAYAHLANLSGESTADDRRRLDEQLEEVFEYELADEKERKRLEYRRRAREIGADVGQQALMDAFALPTTGRVPIQ